MSVLTVSQLNNYISFKIKSDVKLKGIMVQGEISNFVNHYKSGHIYFTLKDNSSVIKAVMFSSSASKLKFIPSDGMKVIVSGNVEVYDRDGVYQIYVTDMQPSGLGALYLAFEQLKNLLSAEGLFDEKYKKPIPEFPERIGIITSASGAGLQDMLKILSRRYPIGEVIVYPSIVQGELSVKSLCDNLINADNNKFDVIIIGRGGGSFEDLNSFNSEELARVIFECQTPIISAVGHETDTTIADFVADLRAPTPSAAAEIVAPDINALIDILNVFKYKLNSAIIQKIDSCQHVLEFQYNKINNLSPINMLNIKSDEVDKIQKRLYNSYINIIKENEMALNEKISLLNSLSPLNILSRGYSLVYKNDDIVYNSKNLSLNDEIKIKFYDTQISATVTKV